MIVVFRSTGILPVAAHAAVRASRPDTGGTPVTREVLVGRCGVRGSRRAKACISLAFR